MGTRADFYVGRDKGAEWLGSIAWDGYRDGIPAQILGCTSEEAFRHAVAEFLATREDKTLPEDGWPWPWEDSSTTDCSYWFFDGRCWDEHESRYVPADEELPNKKRLRESSRIEFPNMSKMKQRARFGAHSGVILVGGGK